MVNRIDEEKRAAAEAAALRVADGMVVGLGTGSTAEFAIHALGARVSAGLRMNGVPTSKRSEHLARQVKIPIISIHEIEHIDLTIDGADEIDQESLALIKGRGGALAREKLIAVASDCVIIVADASKIVSTLGILHPIPVEVLPFGWWVPSKQIGLLGGAPTLRTNSDGSAYITDNGNYILDVTFGPIADPGQLAAALKSITGVIDHGLFIDIADIALVATGRDVREYRYQEQR